MNYSFPYVGCHISLLVCHLLPNPRWRGKFERELRADADFAMDFNPAAVGFDDAAGGGEAEAGAAALGGVEGVEHFHGGSFVHADARVDQVEGHALSCHPGAGRELTAVGHGFQGIFHQVDERRLQRLGIQLNARQVGIEIAPRSRYALRDPRHVAGAALLRPADGDVRRTAEFGTTRQVFTSPLHPYTTGLMEAFPSIKGPWVPLTGIPGSPPNLADLPDGCRFAPRCPKVMDRCLTTELPLFSVSGELVRCLLHENAEVADMRETQ